MTLPLDLVDDHHNIGIQRYRYNVKSGAVLTLRDDVDSYDSVRRNQSPLTGK